MSLRAPIKKRKGNRGRENEEKRKALRLVKSFDGHLDTSRSKGSLERIKLDDETFAPPTI